MTGKPETVTQMSSWRKRLRRCPAAAAVALLLLALLVVGLRPWYMHWGATSEEGTGIYAGDYLAPDVRSLATRAISIDAPPEKVWPWIAQVGEDRAGFYSYTWLENLFRADMRNADAIHAEWQQREVGQPVWLARPDRYHGTACTVIAVYEPGRAMVLVSPPDYEKLTRSGPPISGVWTFILQPDGLHGSRLIMRSRGRSEGLLKRAFDYFVFDPAHFVMERGMMLGIKQRASKTVAGMVDQARGLTRSACARGGAIRDRPQDPDQKQ